MIWKIWKKIGKWFGKYGRKASRLVIRYGQYGRKASWIVKRYEKYGRKASWIVKRFGNTEENCEMIWKIMEEK